jgi:hypothetical protein
MSEMTEKAPLTTTLTTKGLGNISRTEAEADFDFEFVVQTRRYRCPWFIAEFLSPTLSSLRSTDPTLNEMAINTVDDQQVFGDFLLLGKGCDLVVTASNYLFFVSLCRELGNGELYLALINHFEEGLNLSNVLERLSSRELFFGSDSSSFPELDFLASHFHELKDSFLSSLDADHIHSILSNPSLRITSEDDLYRFIVSRLGEDRDCSSLLSFVRFEFLSVSSIEHFLSIEFDSFTLLSRSVWNQLCRRLILSVSPSSPNDRLIGRHFVWTETAPFEGIISHLTSKHGGNVHDRGIVNISGVTPCSTGSDYLPKNVADLTATTTYFFSRDESNQMLIYDFQKSRITLTHYSIRSFHSDGENGRHLKSWVLEVSSDGSNWVEIDRRENNNELNGASKISTFSISKSMECRMIRLCQIGQNHQGNHHLLFSALEIFGFLIES